ncbi:hypothetical protein BLNAU_13408 [Blattamonas nauphoetae]|uniref:Uncharacterized protein n=1 Tax=Blattamonas nauphoetae TaxID=2049346 RepID=A0ABQ9XLG3_9EUKA|nr:hypothetical protein BLNAU_13408 [Blattamonas nauphoetae]
MISSSFVSQQPLLHSIACFISWTPLPASHLSSSCLHQLILCTDQDDPLVILPRFELALLASQLLILLFQPLKACPLCVRSYRLCSTLRRFSR